MAVCRVDPLGRSTCISGPESSTIGGGAGVTSVPRRLRRVGARAPRRSLQRRGHRENSGAASPSRSTRAAQARLPLVGRVVTARSRRGPLPDLPAPGLCIRARRRRLTGTQRRAGRARRRDVMTGRDDPCGTRVVLGCSPGPGIRSTGSTRKPSARSRRVFDDVVGQSVWRNETLCQ